MRYYYETRSIIRCHYGVVYICNHPVYNRCTLYTIKDKGLAVIQQRFDPETKTTYWSEIDLALQDELFLHPNFLLYFQKRAATANNGLYPTVTIRQIMWALRLKPLPKQRWETVFDRKDI